MKVHAIVSSFLLSILCVIGNPKEASAQLGPCIFSLEDLCYAENIDCEDYCCVEPEPEDTDRRWVCDDENAGYQTIWSLAKQHYEFFDVDEDNPTGGWNHGLNWEYDYVECGIYGDCKDRCVIQPNPNCAAPQNARLCVPIFPEHGKVWGITYDWIDPCFF